MMFTTRIASVLEKTGFKIHWIDQFAEWKNPPIHKITQINPILILVDLGISEIQWDSWIMQVKKDAETKDIPLLCFESHKETASIQAARQAGADRVISRSGFFSHIGEIIEQVAANNK
jgi:DNA-binding NarL/FixJ family response regulator